MLTKAPKGTRDMLPKEAYKWHYIERKFADLCSRYNFLEMRTPVFEHTSLFVRGVGDTTDIVQKEMYTWEQGKRSLTLRPEGTSPVMRGIIEHKLYAESLPQKIYYNASCFRYEKPQSGRLRQFHQFGAEVFGSDSMIADSEIIALANDLLRELRIENLNLEINSVGCSECKPNHRNALKEFLRDRYDDLCDTCKDRYERNPMRIMDCKNPTCQEIVKNAPVMIDYLCEDCSHDFDDLKANLDALKIQYEINPKIVRGLDYYTKTAFEFITTTIGAQGTVCGGGRYNNLSEELGGPHIPGVGFGMGQERLLLFMENSGIQIPLERQPRVLVAFTGREERLYAVKLVKFLRGRGIIAEIDGNERNLKGQFKLADRIGVEYTLVIGSDELAQGKITVKNMRKSEQYQMDFDRDKLIEILVSEE